MSLAQPWRDSLKPEKLPETGETPRNRSTCLKLERLLETGETATEAESENTWTKHDFRFDIIEQIS